MNPAEVQHQDAEAGGPPAWALAYAEELFGEDPAGRSHATELLQQAARIASDLFHPAAIDLIFISAAQPPLARLCLSIVAALSSRRGDLADRLISVAVRAIDARLPVEIAAEILLGCGCGTSRAIPAGVIQKVVTRQNHIRPFGGWPTRHPDCPLVDIAPAYTFSTSLLVRACDQDPETVLVPVRSEFRNNNKLRRVNACGVVMELLKDIWHLLPARRHGFAGLG